MPPPLIYLGGLLSGLALAGSSPCRLSRREASRAFGFPLLAGGVSVAGWFGRTMRRAGTPFRLDGPATILVTASPFRYIRRPRYPSFAMIRTRPALLLGESWAVAMVPASAAVIRRRVIQREERYLGRAFGGEYLRYEAGARRWIQVSAEIPQRP